MTSHEPRSVNYHKYFIAFLVTAFIFGVAYLLAEYMYTQRIDTVKSIEDRINRNILESEIQYQLLADSACQINDDTLLTEEMNTLAQKLQYMEEQQGVDTPEVLSLKKYYSLLQVKNYLLLKESARQCDTSPVSILYFYSNTGDCGEACKKEGYVLTDLRQQYPGLHVYAFDYNLDLGVINTLKAIYKLDNVLPALVINRQPYYGFKDQAQIENLIPNIETLSGTTTKPIVKPLKK